MITKPDMRNITENLSFRSVMITKPDMRNITENLSFRSVMITKPGLTEKTTPQREPFF